MQISKPNITSNSIENEYSNSTPIEHRKKYAQFFTPFPIADLMAKWILGNENLKTVLEPAFGLGIFTRALLNYNDEILIKGFEIDANIFSKSQDVFAHNENITLHLKDYMYNDWNNKYDGILCNPPYFKFHDYDNINILKEVEDRISCKLNGFTNLYTLFLLKSIYQLEKNGRAAYIIPSEFLNSDYGKLVKKYLIESKTLRHIVVIDFEENVFDDALTTATIVLCSNDNKTDKVQFTNINNINDLSKVENLIQSYPNFTSDNQIFDFNTLNPDIKWKAYYQKQNCINYKHLVPFANFGKVVRGIATGANDYFTFSISKAEKHKIPANNLLPCICKAIDSKKSFFLKEDFDELVSNDKSAFLLNAIAATDINTNNYLRLGEEQEINRKFLTSKRNPWYSLENRPPAPIWVSVFNRNGLRFIRNEANISNLTTFHCIYPSKSNLFDNINIDLLFAYLLTDVAKQIFEDNCREYGNGLQKFEPNDINKAQMLDLNILDSISISRILNLYHSYRETVIAHEPNSCILSQINEIFIENFYR